MYKSYKHNPPHLFQPSVSYMVTGAMKHKEPLLNTDDKKGKLCELLFERASILEWQLEAWSVLPNHYHFIARAPKNANTLSMLIRSLHSLSARYINSIDHRPGRQVWWNYWDRCIRDEASYLSMLHYVHMNPVKHGITHIAEDYPFCSYRWFMDHAESEFRKRVQDQPVDRLLDYDQI